MQIHKRITTTLLTAVVLAGLNANAQFSLPPPLSSTPPLTRNIQAEVAQMTQRYGLSGDQAMRVATILQDEAKKSEDAFSDSTLTMKQQASRLQSLKMEEISRVSDVLIPKQKQKYEADVRLTPPAQSPASGAAAGLPNLPSNY